MDAEPASRTESRLNWHFVGSVALTFAFICAAFPSVSWRAEMHWETGTNFFATAYQKSLRENVTETDMGYLPWLPRLISVVAVKGFGVVKDFPNAVHLIGAAVIALLAAYVNLRVFRSVIPNDGVRFLISVGIGFGLTANCGAYNLFNVAYFGTPVLALLPFVDKQSLGPFRYAFHLFWGGILILSKGTFVIFGPVAGVLMARDVYRRRWKSAAFHAVLVLATAVQTHTLMESRERYRDRPDYQVRGVHYPLEQTEAFVGDVGTLYQRMFPYALVDRAEPDSQVQLGLLIAVVAGILCLRLARQRRWRPLALIGLCLGGSLASIGLMTVGTPADHPHQLDGYNHPMAPSNLCLLLAMGTLLAGAIADKGGQLVAVGGVLLIAAVCRPTPVLDWGGDPAEDHSQWPVYRQLLEYDDYFIPVNGEPWGMAKGCYQLNVARRIDLDGTPLVAVRGAYDGSEHWKVRAVMFALSPEERRRVGHLQLAACAGDRCVAMARRLTEPGLRYQYFLFEQPTRVGELHVLDAEGRPLPIHAENVRIYGRWEPKN